MTRGTSDRPSRTSIGSPRSTDRAGSLEPGVTLGTVPPVKWFDVGQEAHGVIAIGQLATGVFALGQFATGVVAIGQLARGVVAIGQLAVGVVAVGQMGVGILYGSGMLGFGAFAGGLIPLGVVGRLPFGELRRGRLRSIERRQRIGALSILAFVVVVAIVWAAALGPLRRELFDIGGVIHRMS